MTLNDTAAGRYQPFSEEEQQQDLVGVEANSGADNDEDPSPSTRTTYSRPTTGSGKRGGRQPPPAAAAAGPPRRAIVVHSDEEGGGGGGPSSWQDNGHVLPGARAGAGPGGDATRDRYSSRGGGNGMPGNGDDDEDDTRRWEEAEEEGAHDYTWPGQEREEWGHSSTRRGGGVHGTPPPRHGRHVGEAGSDETASASARRSQHNRLTRSPPPSGVPHANGGGCSSNGSLFAGPRQRPGGQHDNAFGDDHAWGDVDNATATASATNADSLLERASGRGTAQGHSTSIGGHQQQAFREGGEVGAASVGSGAPWSSQAAPAESSAHSPPTAEKSPHGAPSQSKLVQRVFGARGRRERSRGGGGTLRGGRGRLQTTGRGGVRGGGGVGGRGVVVEEEGAGGGIWLMQAEVQKKLRELEEEVGVAILAFLRAAAAV